MSERMERAIVETVSLMACIIEDLDIGGKCQSEDLIELKQRIYELRTHVAEKSFQRSEVGADAPEPQGKQ